jgi:hypothetical protein
LHNQQDKSSGYITCAECCDFCQHESSASVYAICSINLSGTFLVWLISANEAKLIEFISVGVTCLLESLPVHLTLHQSFLNEIYWLRQG